jgi:hypothetical protein
MNIKKTLAGLVAGLALAMPVSNLYANPVSDRQKAEQNLKTMYWKGYSFQDKTPENIGENYTSPNFDPYIPALSFAILLFFRRKK